MERCGTPDVTGNQLECTLLTTTRWFLFEKYDESL